MRAKQNNNSNNQEYHSIEFKTCPHSMTYLRYLNIVLSNNKELKYSIK